MVAGTGADPTAGRADTPQGGERVKTSSRPVYDPGVIVFPPVTTPPPKRLRERTERGRNESPGGG
jgi:hypothetical protein